MHLLKNKMKLNLFLCEQTNSQLQRHVDEVRSERAERPPRISEHPVVDLPGGLTSQASECPRIHRWLHG